MYKWPLPHPSLSPYSLLCDLKLIENSLYCPPPLSLSLSLQPLFYHVQLHPGLITGGEKVELSKAKWGAMEPLDIATLSYQLCMDTSLAVQEEKQRGKEGRDMREGEGGRERERERERE